jgi:hypothetical protein
MNDKDIYHGFAPEKQAEYEEQLIDHLGDEGSEGIEAARCTGASWARKTCAPRSRKARRRMALARAHSAQATRSTPTARRRRSTAIAPGFADVGPRVSGEGYGGMADLTRRTPDFRARYDSAGEGFTDWLTTAMKAYAARLA